MVSTFRIVLGQDEGYDAHETREFDLELGSKFSIGRASKNTSKGYLLPAKNNVYIDSPVVSREHAILTANATSGTPQVYITDTKSMHGTHVNGTPLVPHTPKQLCNGDRLQFGINVNRNESYFVAFKYTFNAELSSHESFSRGFTVPEAESEEEEPGFAQSGRGSQLNPLILDDSDAESEPEAHEEHEEHAEHSEDNADVTLARLQDAEEVLEIEDFSEEEGSAKSDAASTGSTSQYRPESVLVQEVQYPDGKTPGEMAPPDWDPESLLDHAAKHMEEFKIHEQVATAKQSQTTPLEQEQHPATPLMPFDLPGAERASVDLVFTHLYPEVPNFAPPAWQGVDNHVNLPTNMVDSTFAPSLPPRPSQKRQRIWDEPPQAQQAWLPGASSGVPTVVPLAFAYEGLVPPVRPVSALLPPADSIQTPSPTTPADIVTPTSPPSTRRTGVSIPEIVDEQPPTLTSINSRKRSADDALDEPEAEEVAPQQQRLIAQPKSILRRALHAARVMVPATALGAAFTVGALTALPESFFTVA